MISLTMTMKNLSLLVAFVSSASTMATPANAQSMSLSSSATAAVIEKVRRRQEQDGNYDEQLQAHLVDYSAKMIECIPSKVIKDDNGDKAFGTVLFRLCPSNHCSDNKEMGCSSGYADFAVALKTYVYAYLEDQQDNMNWDDGNFGSDDFVQCAAYEADDGNEYYVGPACTSDGLGVKFGLFYDGNCTMEASDANVNLPFSSGGLVDSSCVSCSDDGALNEMCEDMYDAAQYRCETEWDFQHYYYDAMTEVYRYGQDEVGCKFINGYEKRPSGKTDWGEVFFIFLLVATSVGGFVMYNQWWNEKKLNLEKIQDDEDDDEDDEDDEGSGGDYHVVT